MNGRKAKLRRKENNAILMDSAPSRIKDYLIPRRRRRNINSYRINFSALNAGINEKNKELLFEDIANKLCHEVTLREARQYIVELLFYVLAKTDLDEHKNEIATKEKHFLSLMHFRNFGIGDKKRNVKVRKANWDEQAEKIIVSSGTVNVRTNKIFYGDELTYTDDQERFFGILENMASIVFQSFAFRDKPNKTREIFDTKEEMSKVIDTTKFFKNKLILALYFVITEGKWVLKGEEYKYDMDSFILGDGISLIIEMMYRKWTWYYTEEDDIPILSKMTVRMAPLEEDVFISVTRKLGLNLTHTENPMWADAVSSGDSIKPFNEISDYVGLKMNSHLKNSSDTYLLFSPHAKRLATHKELKL